jgi:hypothetical protein
MESTTSTTVAKDVQENITTEMNYGQVDQAACG